MAQLRPSKNYYADIVIAMENMRRGPTPKGRTEKVTVTLTERELRDAMVLAARKSLKLPNYLRTLLGLEA